jgi:membrane protease subunit (stomatin/prohibitin family)
MGLFDKLKGEFIDVIEWTDDSNNTLVYRFERYGNEIKNSARLTVREGQRAVFVNQGKLADVFEPGMHTLSTQNLPILSTLKGWKHGFNSPFKSEVYFVNTRNFTDQKWGTKSPIVVNDDRFGMLEIRAFGTYVIRVADASKFLREIVGTDGHFTNEEIAKQLRSIIVTRFSDAVGESRIPVEGFAANLNEISELVGEIMRPEFRQYGLELVKILVENISMPEDVKKEIFELSRLNRVDLHKLAQIKAAKAMEAAASNPGGSAGDGIGMGMGFAMANQMGNMFGQVQGRPQGQAGASVPPPIPPQNLAYFVAVNGQQQGPFDMNVLKNMAQQQQLTRASLVWKEGMSAWTKAEDIAELIVLFASQPPPLPG